MKHKNIVFWIGVKSSNPEVRQKWNYGNYEWMDYSRKTWEYWCKKNDCHFIAYEEPKHSDTLKYKINWQRWFDVFDYIKTKGITDYDQILLTDASIMVKWDAPNYFDITDHKFCALRGTENLKWTYESTIGYADIFPNVKFRINDYIASGFCIFNKSHKPVLDVLETFYYQNHEKVLDLEDKLVKRGRDQPVLNYILRQEDVEIKYLPIVYGVSHLYRHDILKHNWQLNENMTPFFIKYFHAWIFSGWPDRGKTRNELMSQTWNLVKHHYEIDRLTNDEILDEIDHKDTAKYTTSKKMKRDILEIFRTDKFKDKTVIEIGASQGQSTRMLSHIFKKVIAVEWDDWNLEQAMDRNADRDNVEFVQMDLYKTKWKGNLPTDVDVVFIDADHRYPNVKMDIENALECFDNPIFIFDDYGFPPGEVKQAVDEKIQEGKLELYKFIGEKPDDLVHASGTKFFDMEGCVCNFK